MTTSWNWKWLLFTPVILGAATMFVAASVTPKRYLAETTILVEPQRVAERFSVPPPQQLDSRLWSIQQQVLSRRRLEHVIEEFNLYEAERKAAQSMEDIVERMRGDITVDFSLPKGAPAGIRAPTFRLGYISTDPKKAAKVAGRLASLFIEENLKARAVLAEGTSQFLQAQIESLRQRLIERAKRAKAGIAPAEVEAFAIEGEALTSTLKSLLMKREEAFVAANIEQREIGEQFRVLDQARIPDRPISPNRAGMTVGGAVIGFGAGFVLLLVAALRRSAP